MSRFPPARLILSLLAGIVCTAGIAHAAGIAFAAVLPNGKLYRAPVESMQAARFRNIVRQHTDFSCGAAALATLLKYGYDLNVDEATVLAGLMGVADPEQVRKQGFSLLDIKHYVDDLGLRGRGYRITETRLLTVRVPTIVLIQTNGYRHFVVLKLIDHGRVEIADPALGNTSMSLAQFMQVWPSRALFAVIGSGFDRNTVLLQPQRTPSARELYARSGPLTDSELLDFGFTSADLF
ncbi:MAG: peptidase [Rhodanobacteraceae bacterium]|nr:MAG: peptidase [Rhodanobacteraceae bacterium]